MQLELDIPTFLEVDKESLFENISSLDLLDKTPVPSPSITFGNIDDSFSESTPIMSDNVARTSPLGSSEFSSSTTPCARKKKRTS